MENKIENRFCSCLGSDNVKWEEPMKIIRPSALEDRQTIISAPTAQQSCRKS